MTDKQPSLEELQKTLEAALAAAEAAKEAFNAAKEIEKKSRLKEVLKSIKEFQFTQDEICKGMGWKVGQATAAENVGTRKRRASLAPPKYRNPDNENETWSGQGALKEWAESYLISAPGEKPRKFRSEILNPARLKYDQENAQKKK